jgi:hypothetical protein
MMVPMTRYDEENKKIDYEALRWLLSNMHQNHLLFKLIRAEMEARGNWKAAPKGKGFQPGDDQRRHILPTSPLRNKE